jgi:phospholipid N-methyltransferase
MQKWANSGAGPIQVKRFNDTWGKINWENNTFVELTGIVGVQERRTVCSMLGGRETRPDVAAAQERIGERFDWTITRENIGAVVTALAEELAVLEQNRPVKDQRTTPDAEAERRAEQARRVTEGKEKAEQAAAAFIRHYGSGEKVTLQPGQAAIVAQVCFDNSDSMTDYFDPHASLSQTFVLAVVPKQAETERLARRGVKTSPLLSTIDFEWHTEKYSMGHGNYLESKDGFELPTELQGLRNRYGSGGEVTRAHWEVTFQTAYREPVTLDTIAGYGKAGPEPDKAREPVEDVTVSENDEKNGIEIRFPSKPSAAVLDSLKAQGWRWSRFSSCWYTRRTDAARQFAASLSGQAGTGDFSPIPATPVSSIAPRFRTWANALQPKIDHAGRPMSQNPTPKRNREYQSRIHDCRNMERLQKALQVLADAHEARTVPTELAGLKTRDEIGTMVRKSTTGGGGYYSVIEADDYTDKSPTARLLQGMIEGNPKQRAERERLRKIEALQAEMTLSTIPGYFPTPTAVIEAMLDRAALEPGMMILEPSAGSGNIADAIREQFPAVQIHCFELNQKLAELLRLKGHCVEGNDFLVDEQVARIYDRVLMNPPFERQQDIDHVRKAYRALKPGGRLVTIMASGFESRQNHKSAEFRAWLDEVEATWEDLPDGSFKASGTGVRTRLVVVDRVTGQTVKEGTGQEARCLAEA